MCVINITRLCPKQRHPSLPYPSSLSMFSLAILTSLCVQLQPSQMSSGGLARLCRPAWLQLLFAHGRLISGPEGWGVIIILFKSKIIPNGNLFMLRKVTNRRLCFTDLLTWSGFRSFPGSAVRKDMFVPECAPPSKEKERRGLGVCVHAGLKNTPTWLSVTPGSVCTENNRLTSHTIVIVTVREGSTDHYDSDPVWIDKLKNTNWLVTSTSCLRDADGTKTASSEGGKNSRDWTPPPPKWLFTFPNPSQTLSYHFGGQWMNHASSNPGGHRFTFSNILFWWERKEIANIEATNQGWERENTAVVSESLRPPRGDWRKRGSFCFPVS